MRGRVILSRAHRDALYKHLLQNLSEVEDLQRFGASRDPDRIEDAERIGRRMADALRLIQDGGIGWGFTDDKDPLELKLPPEELRRIFESMRGDLAALQESESADREESEAEWHKTEQAREASISVLYQLGGSSE